MASADLELRKLKLDRLSVLLGELWMSVSPSERQRRVILCQFMDLHKKVRSEQLKLEQIIIKESK
jgi:hypothetical protein